jgi:hypothetical protein
MDSIPDWNNIPFAATPELPEEDLTSTEFKGSSPTKLAQQNPKTSFGESIFQH